MVIAEPNEEVIDHLDVDVLAGTRQDGTHYVRFAGDLQLSIEVPDWPPKPKPAILVGTAINKDPGGANPRTRIQRYQRLLDAGARPDYVRAYLDPPACTLANFPVAWPVGNPTQSGEFQDLMLGGRGTFLSMKPDWVQFANGQYDGKLKQLLDSYPGTRLWVAMQHEPEDDFPAGSAILSAWRAAYLHLISFMAAYVLPAGSPQQAKPEVWQVFEGYTWQTASHRDPNTWFVDGIDGLGIDVYNVPSSRHDGTPWPTPLSLVSDYAIYCEAKGVKTGWIEIGCQPDFDVPTRRGDWLAQGFQTAIDLEMGLFSYFDSTGGKGDWQVDDIVRRTAYYPNTLGTVLSVSRDAYADGIWLNIIKEK